MDIDRIVIERNSTTSIRFHRGFTYQEYTIKEADLPRLWKIFNEEPWPCNTEFDLDGNFEQEFHVSDRELPLDQAFFTPNLEPDPNQAYWDYLETMNDFIESTRS